MPQPLAPYPAEDLAANRQGRLGATQQSYLLDVARRSRLLFYGLSGVFALAFLLSMLTRSSTQSSASKLGTLIFLLCILLVLDVSIEFRVLRPYQRALRAGDVLAVDGQAQWKGRNRLAIGPRTYSANPGRVQVGNGQPCRGYVLRGQPRILVTAEPLGPPPAG